MYNFLLFYYYPADKNKFTGPIPNSVGKLSQLEFLSFCKYRQIIVCLHIFISTWLQLTLNFDCHSHSAENKMKGDLPTDLGNLVLLDHLDFRKCFDFSIINTLISQKSFSYTNTIFEFFRWLWREWRPS